MSLGRNDRCWCKSGSKYKDCHYESDRLIEKYKREGFVVPEKRSIKSKVQIKGIKESAKITKGVLLALNDFIKAGVTTGEIDQFVYDFTVERGGIPAPLNYKNFPKSVCTSVNHVICHGIPGIYKLKDGDIINVDVSTVLDGYFSDASMMYTIGNLAQNAEKLVRVAKECLYKGIEAVRPFETMDVIGHAIEPYAIENGCSIVRDYGGHGIGLEFHEEPFVNHFQSDEQEMIMLPGMVFTIEPMVNEGSYKAKLLKDKWTAVTKDAKLSAQWEHTVLVTDDGHEIIC